MPVTLPLEIYETFEERFGKDDARKLGQIVRECNQ
jgi:hypothetical protein